MSRRLTMQERLARPVFRKTDEESTSAHFVYRLFSKTGALLYVGCAYDVEHRVYMHLRTTTMRDWDLIWRHYGSHTSERYANKVEARAAERRAIHDEAPALNRQHNPKRWRRQQGQWVPATPESLDAYLELTKRPEPDPEFADFLNGLFKPRPA